MTAECHMHTPLRKRGPSRSTTYRNPAVRKPEALPQFNENSTIQNRCSKSGQRAQQYAHPCRPPAGHSAESAPHQSSNMQESCSETHQKRDGLHPQLRDASQHMFRVCTHTPCCLRSSKVRKAEGKGHLSSWGEIHTLKLVSQVGGAADVVQDSPCTLRAQTQQHEVRHCPLKESPELCKRAAATTMVATCGVHHACPERERARRYAKPAVPWLPSAAGGPVVKTLGVICVPPATSSECDTLIGISTTDQWCGPAFSADTASRKQPMVNLRKQGTVPVTILAHIEHAAPCKLCTCLLRMESPGCYVRRAEVPHSSLGHGPHQ